MKNGWRIILGIVLVAILLGSICFGVGILTGSDMHRIVQNLDSQYQLTAYIDAYTEYAHQLFDYAKSLIGL
ncbi:MAG: hypothetical protein IJQ02_12160 [Oscillospiraceae bacterium]|nr:hypothetical protein [Oscillospiraceae bacterium]